MECKTYELSGTALNWAVARATGTPDVLATNLVMDGYSPSSDWSQGGPLLNEYAVSVRPVSDAQWMAEEFVTHNKAGAAESRNCNAYLTAAMRVIVMAEIGDVVDVPEELV